MNEAADKSMFKMMGVTGVAIMIMLFIVYRSISTVLLVLVTVGFEMGTARGLVALLGNYNLLGFSTFVVAMLSSLAIAAGTDYAIFLIGRYQEARQAGQDRETAYYTDVPRHLSRDLGLGADDRRGHVLPALGTPVVFPRHSAFRPRVGLLVVVAGALTAAPAVVAVATRFGLLDPRRTDQDARVAAHRHRYRALARSGVRGLAGASPSIGIAHHAQHQDQLQRPLLHTPRTCHRMSGMPPSERHLQRRHNESRHPHDRQ